MISSTLTMSGTIHARLRRHLFPGDGLEAAAILVCSRIPGPRTRLLVRDVVEVPYAECRRGTDSINWPGHFLEMAIDHGESQQLSLVLLHSHPGGRLRFSDIDDVSDGHVMPCLQQAYKAMHGTAIMVSDGAVVARLYDDAMRCTFIEMVSVIGDDIRLFWASDQGEKHGAPRPMPFASGMRNELGKLSCVVIGVSGIGSIIAEQAARLGFGEVRLIDFDWIELKNLNRILNSTLEHAKAKSMKVEVLADAIKSFRSEGVAKAYGVSINTMEAVLAASQADVLFCSVDSFEGRQIADLLASSFLLPLFDVGVSISTRKVAGGLAVAEVTGRIDYVQPGGSSLADRGVYTEEDLRSEHLSRVSPETHAELLKTGYIRGAIEQAPSVITLNMRAGSAVLNEFIARCYPFRLEPNRRYARTMFYLAACEEEFFAEDDFQASPSPVFARGSEEPLLGIHALVKPS